jgi:hypothetical protein
MTYTPSTARQLRDMADTQLGLVTSAQLAELGITSGAQARRTVGGMWTRVLPGVHLVDGGDPNRLQREYAAFLYAGPGARVTGLTALRHHRTQSLGLQLVRPADSIAVDPVHLLIDRARRRISTGYARIERTMRLPDPVRVPGVPMLLAPVARAVADACRRMRSASDVNALVSEVVRRQMCSVDELRVELDLGQRRGSGLLRDAVTGVETGAWSGPEIDLVTIMQTGRIPNVLYNVRLLGPDGLYIGTPDAWIDDVAVAVEVDSVEHHADDEGFKRTVRRNARYAAAGILVVSVLPSDERNHAASILKSIQAARHAGSQRPRPDITVVQTTSRTAHQRGWRYGA